MSGPPMAFELPHWRLSCITLFHAFIGFAALSNLTLFGAMGEWVKVLTNESIISHYNTEPSSSTIEWIWSILNAMVIMGVMVGSGTLQWVAESLGRRNTVMVVKNIIAISAAILQVLSKPLNCIEMLIVGRFIAGIAICQTNFIGVYLAESSPTQHRGVVSTFGFNVGTHTWFFLGSLVAMFVNEDTWHYAFLFPLVPSVVHLAATPLIPKSVKHLYITEGKTEQARKASTFYNGTKVDLNTMQEEMKQEADISPTLKVANLRSTLAASQFRWPLLLCVGPIVSYALGGLDVAIFYSGTILLNAGVPVEKLAMCFAFFIHLPSLVLSVFSVYLIERFGRRPLLLTGVFQSALGGLFLVVISPLESASATAASVSGVIGLSLVMVGFTIGPGVLAFTLPAEIAPQASRSLTAGLSGVMNSVIGLIIALIFPYLANVLNSYAVFFVVIYDVALLVFLWKFLPESKGKSVAAVVERWMPSRKRAQTVPLNNL